MGEMRQVHAEQIRDRSDYETVIYDSPIDLLKAIKEHALSYDETRYEMSIISDALRALLNTKQKEHESLQHYTRRFERSRDILETHVGGPIVLSKYVMTMTGYDETNPAMNQELIDKASEQFLAFIYLENSDQEKYGSILSNLNSQKSLGNDQYPRTLADTTNVLRSHKFDSAKGKRSHEPNKKTS